MLAMLVRATDEDGRSLTDRELRDQLMTLIVAGHDTTATGLSWALERLTATPPSSRRPSGRPTPKTRQATSTSTRWPRRHCGSARWCSTWAAC